MSVPDPAVPVWLACPFCGRKPSLGSLGYQDGGKWVDWVTIGCDAAKGGCGCSQSDKTLAEVAAKWNTRKLVGDEQKILHAAQTNRIWLNAMTDRWPSSATLRELGQNVMNMLNEPANLTVLGQEAPTEAERSIGRLTPVLFLGINRS